MKGFSQVFSFTFKHIAGEKKYKSWTVILALLLFLAPAVILPLSEKNRSDPDQQKPLIEVETGDLGRVKEVFYAVETDDGFAWDSLGFRSDILFVRCESLADAYEAAEKAGEGAYVLVIRQEEGRYQIIGLAGDEAVNEELLAAEALAENVASQLPVLLATEMHISSDQAQALYAGVGVVSSDEDGDAENALFREIAGWVLPYVNIMLIYFLVLFYGNTVANNVILEKTSKLMDTFLISVKPKAMILGKVLAAWATSLLQLIVWGAALFGGCALGSHLARSIHPNSTMGVLRFFDYLGMTMKLFSPLHILVALLLIAAGFLLYCSLAGVAGSFASKPEELSSVLYIFQLFLIVSFFIVLRVVLGNGMGAPDGPMWYDFVPFTAILITPSRLLMDQVPLWTGLAALGLTALLALVVTYFAGKVYSMMSLYKGSVPKPREMLKIIFGKA
ncbi:MAG: ABC transporter permease [Lachnospiraceae bacterium]|nr:ABC transporter permease [Lachnospiraceae bacterium]